MANRAAGTFTTDWDIQPPYQEAEGNVLGKAKVTKVFAGELVGTSTAELIQAGTSVPGSAAYVAIERVEGALHGRKGTFLLMHSGLMTGGEGILDVTVVPDSGTGELAGLAGSMTITNDDGHAYVLDYSLGGAT
jgi:hypothetical protein